MRRSILSIFTATHMSTNTQYQENWVVPEFKGKACVIKSWRLEWAPILSKFADNPNIAVNLPDHFPQPFTEPEAINYINGILNDNNKRRRYLAICVENGDKIEPIGTVCGVALDGGKKHRVELGYYLSEDYWGKGIVTEAAKLMVKYFFSDDYTYQVNDGQPIVRVDCNIYSWNRGSEKVAEKLGFTREAYQQQGWLKKGKVVDGTVYRLLKDEFLANPFYSS